MLRTALLGLLLSVIALPSPAQPSMRDSLEAERLFIQGLLQQHLGAHEAAIQRFSQALEYVPEQPAILSALAESHAARKDYEEAFRYARRALEREPDNRTYLYQAARFARDAGHPDVARALYETLIAQHRADSEAYLQLARLYVQERHFRQAAATYERLLAREPDQTSVYFQLLRLYEQLNDHEGRIRTLERLCERQPGNTYLLKQLIAAYTAAGHPEKAIRYLERALQEQPDDLALLLDLADLYRSQHNEARADSLVARFMALTEDQPESLLEHARRLLERGTPEDRMQAIEVLERFRNHTKDHPKVPLLLGRAYYAQGKFDKAAPLLEEALKTHVRDLDLWSEAAEAYLHAGQPRKALAIAERGLLLFPGQIPLLFVGGMAAVQTYQNDRAHAMLQEALTYLSDVPDADPLLQAQIWTALGILYTRKQQLTRADSAYEAALQVAPDWAPALNNYAYSLAERGIHLDKALEMARNAVEIEPENPSYLDTLGWVYFRMQRLQEARRYVEQAIERLPERAIYHEHLGDILHTMGNREAARAAYRKALELDPENSRLREKIDRQYP